MGKKLKLSSDDKIVHDVVKKFDQRSAAGLKKYGQPLSTDSDSLYRWVNDVQEEMMDAILYLQKVKTTLTELAEEEYIQDYKNEMLSTNISTYPESNIEVTYEIVKP